MSTKTDWEGSDAEFHGVRIADNADNGGMFDVELYDDIAPFDADKGRSLAAAILAKCDELDPQSQAVPYRDTWPEMGKRLEALSETIENTAKEIYLEIDRLAKRLPARKAKKGKKA